MVYESIRNPIICCRCGSEDVKLIDVLVDMYEFGGTNPIYRCKACSAVFDNRPQELKNMHLACWFQNSSIVLSPHEVLKLLNQALMNGGYEMDQLKRHILNELANYSSIDEYKIREIVDTQLVELKQKMDSLCKDSLSLLKTKIANFQLGDG